jgi:hypothetical protein
MFCVFSVTTKPDLPDNTLVHDGLLNVLIQMVQVRNWTTLCGITILLL